MVEKRNIEKSFTLKKSITLICLLVICLPGQAVIHFPAVFSNHMVLQRNSNVAVWGWAEPGDSVKLVGSWNNSDTIVVRADNKSFWSATIRTTEAGGPYTLTAFDHHDTKVLNNVLLGEVWICSGQSNMEWSVNHGIRNGEQEALAANYRNIRFLHVAKIGSKTLQDNCIAAWEICSPETMRKTSALAYFFGRALHLELNVPIGLIVSAWGGTPAEEWLPREEIEKVPALDQALKARRHSSWWYKDPGECYNSMIHPLLPYTIAGAIWYQGEAHVYTGQTQTYDRLMRTLINNWRSGFRKDIPFYYVQLAPYLYTNPQERGYLVREQQVKTMSMPHTGMVVTWDLMEDDLDNPHPLNKQDVGKRLANWALAETYHIPDIIYQSPIYKSMEIRGDKIRITFDHVPTGLKCSGEKITNFMIAGEDHKFVAADAKIDGKCIVVSARGVKKPIAVRFLFDNASMGNLFSNEGMPVGPFRTDNFLIEPL